MPSGTHAYTEGLAHLPMQRGLGFPPSLHPCKTKTQLFTAQEYALGQPTLQERLACFQVAETLNSG